MFFNIKLEKGLSKLIGIDSSKGTLQKGKSRRRFFCPHAKKKAPRHL